MRKAIAIVLTCLAATTVLVAQQPLPISRVLLYKNGMAYIIRTGQLTTPVTLTFHPEDMNDILKSFTAMNPDTGALYQVGYTAGIPSSHMLSRFPFDISRPETGLGTFLTQVKGADIRVESAGKKTEGKLAAVQPTDRVTAPQTSSTTDYRLTLLLKDGSLQTLWLSDVRSVEFVDPQLREQLKSYLEVLSAGRQDVTREVSVYPVPAAGPIQVAYLQQFPLWKTSYRIDLGATQSRIQGWAQIDNPTGEAWENVTVSLLSGAPVSFQMNLYDPLYTSRATVPVPGGQVAAPRRYESALDDLKKEPLALAASETAADAAFSLARPAQGQQGQGQGRGGGAGAPAGGAGGGRGGRGAAVAVPSAPAPPPAAFRNAAEAVFQEAEGLRVEDFYEYKFPFPVRIASRQSALLPFLQKTLNVEKLSIFNARTDRGNPRLGARIENTADIPFEAGPITFFQDARYAGEAVLDYLPRSEKSLVSYGVDYDIQLASKTQGQPETMARVTVAKGVAVMFMESVMTTTYEIRNKGTDSKTLIVEHPRVNNRTLKDAKPIETTDSFYRFSVALKPGQATTLPVAEILSRQTRLTLTQLTREQLTIFAGRETPQEVRTKLGQIVEAQEQVAAFGGEIQTTQASIDALFKDQERLRENLKALDKASAQDQQLRTRYLDQLRKQEDQVQALRGRIDEIKKSMAAAQARLADLIATFAFGA